MSERFALSRPVRVVAGVLAALFVPVGAWVLTWRGYRVEGAGILALAILFGYAAIRGRSPAWLEDPVEAGRALDHHRDRTE